MRHDSVTLDPEWVAWKQDGVCERRVTLRWNLYSGWCIYNINKVILLGTLIRAECRSNVRGWIGDVGMWGWWGLWVAWWVGGVDRTVLVGKRREWNSESGSRTWGGLTCPLSKVFTAPMSYYVTRNILSPQFSSCLFNTWSFLVVNLRATLINSKHCLEPLQSARLNISKVTLE